MSDREQKRQQKKRRSRRIGDLIRLVVLLIAVGALLYPVVSDYIYQKNAGYVLDHYDEQAAKKQSSEVEQMLADARAYNEKLLYGQSIVDPFSQKRESAQDVYRSLLSVDKTGIMGRLVIPKIDVKLPIYHGTGEDSLQRGIGHLEGTSLPVGGAGTHCVLTGHRGLPGEVLLTDLNQLKAGDVFYLRVLGEVLAYQVDQIRVTLPEDTSDLRIQEGKDYCTLLTCTPYGINDHRLLVRGTRIPYEEAQKVQREDQLAFHLSFTQLVCLIGSGILIAMFLLAALIVRRGRKKDEERKQKENA